MIEIRGLKEITARMKAYPQQLAGAVKATMQAALLTLWENVLPYPPEPETSTYDRTGTLGRTLGSSESGGTGGGQPDVYEVREMGSEWEGHFGTNLDYAPPVIGDETQASWMSHWWVISTIANKANEKIQGLFRTMGDKLAAFLEGSK